MLYRPKISKARMNKHGVLSTTFFQSSDVHTTKIFKMKNITCLLFCNVATVYLWVKIDYEINYEKNFYQTIYGLIFKPNGDL